MNAEEELAGYLVALVGFFLVALLVAATNPFALLFVLPALHVWLWLPQLRIARAPVRIALFAVGLVGPALVLGSLAWRFGLGLGAPWYLLELVANGYVSLLGSIVALAGVAAAGQLAAVSAGRYTPYPDRARAGAAAAARDRARLARPILLHRQRGRAPRSGARRRGWG